MFQKLSEYNAQMFEAQIYSYIYSCKDKVLFQKVHTKSVIRTELQITPD